MATWKDMSVASYRAALAMAKLKNHRSAISRAYYSAFAALVHEIRRETKVFATGYEHPQHHQMGRYIKRSRSLALGSDQRQIREALARLYRARLDADYRKDAIQTDSDLKSAIADLDYILRTVGVI